MAGFTFSFGKKRYEKERFVPSLFNRMLNLNSELIFKICSDVEAMYLQEQEFSLIPETQ